jgi:hypothetical protein
MQFLREFFGDHLISKGLWPPRSPDLSPADFFLKGIIYKNNPHTLDDLKRNITTATGASQSGLKHGKKSSRMHC